MNQNDYRAAYEYWRRTADAETEAELRAVTAEEEIADRFYRSLAFGTGGIRGPMGAGTNRINRYTIRKAAAGTALALIAATPRQELKRGVLIAYDTRVNSLKYALETAATLAAFGIPATLFVLPCPVPLLSFALRKGHYLSGVMITASHNPPGDNGFKLYNAKGGQLVPAEAARFAAYMDDMNPFVLNPPSIETAKAGGFLRFTGKAEHAAYLNAVVKGRFKNSPLTVVATPLHGAAKYLLKTALTRAGHQVESVPAQEIWDGAFATVAVPNPEDSAVFALAAAVGNKTGADLLFATDPDGDRCGVSVRHRDQYVPLSGNEIGSLLIAYLLEKAKDRLPADAYIVKTAVTGSLGEKIAARRGVKVLTTPTGFKYIGEALLNPANGTFLAGYEESGGFLAGSHCADKDGIFTAVLLAELAAALKNRGLTLIDALEQLYRAYGYEYNETETFLFPGQDGAADQAACLYCIETNSHAWGAQSVTKIAGDTLVFCFDGHCRLALRPSGTEPKLKLYYTVTAANREDAMARTKTVKATFHPLIEKFLP